MDIANYLSELLNRHGKISVPGLGNFMQVRINGYYNEAEGLFYPPGNQVQFDPGSDEDGDDTLVQFIAEKKNISLASSKYFTEKYIAGLKQEVTDREVTFANLGWFYMDQGQIAFKPQERRSDSPYFHGYEPVAIKKLYQEPEQLVKHDTDFVNTTTVQLEEQVKEEQEDVKRSVNIWLVLLIIAVVIAAAVFAIYKYNPALFNFNERAAKPVTVQPKAKPAIIPDTAAADTGKTATLVSDTAAKAISNADTSLNKTTVNTDTVAKPQFVIFAGSFKTKFKSELAIKNYKSIGIDARILTGPGTGRLIKVIIGSFDTYNEGEALRHKLVKSGKLRKDSYTQIINQKK